MRTTLTALGLLIILALCLGITCHAQTDNSLHTPFKDSTLSQQMHVNIQPQYNEFFMRDTACQLTVLVYAGITDWVRCIVWLYDKNGTRCDLAEREYYLKNDDYAAFWMYGMPYAYKYTADRLNLLIAD